MILVSIYAGLRIFFSPIFEHFSPKNWTEIGLKLDWWNLTYIHLHEMEWIWAQTSTHPTE